jgi:hypothetical protein
MARRFGGSAVFLAAILITAGCADPYADDVSSEDVRVMRAMVNIACKVDAERIVVSDRPAIPRASDLHDSDGHNVRFGIDFDRRLARVSRWPRGQVCPAVRVASDAAISNALEQGSGISGSWENFSTRFGGAHSLMMISLPVYSADGKRAVVYTTGRCPYTCGAGFYHELKKTYEGWQITNSVNAWTS